MEHVFAVLIPTEAEVEAVVLQEFQELHQWKVGHNYNGWTYTNFDPLSLSLSLSHNLTLSPYLSLPTPTPTILPPFRMYVIIIFCNGDSEKEALIVCN